MTSFLKWELQTQTMTTQIVNNHRNAAFKWQISEKKKRGPKGSWSAYLSSSGSPGSVPTCLGKHVWSSRWPSLAGLADRLRGALCSHCGPAGPGWPLSPSARSLRASGLGRSPDAMGSVDHQSKPSNVVTTVWLFRINLTDWVIYSRTRTSAAYKRDWWSLTVAMHAPGSVMSKRLTVPGY